MSPLQALKARLMRGSCAKRAVLSLSLTHEPVAGSGANMALVDAWELAQQLVTGRHTCIQEAIDAYATHAAPRSEKAISGSHRIIALAHAQGFTKLLIVLLLKILGTVMGMSSVGLFWLQTYKFWFTPAHPAAVAPRKQQ